MDDNKDGKISSKEFSIIFDNQKSDNNIEAWEKLILEYDLDKDGEIDYNEFQQLMRQNFS